MILFQDELNVHRWLDENFILKKKKVFQLFRPIPLVELKSEQIRNLITLLFISTENMKNCPAFYWPGNHFLSVKIVMKTDN